MTWHHLLGATLVASSLVWGNEVAAQQSAAGQADAIVRAGQLVAACEAIDPATKPACTTLSKGVANGQDPALTLPVTDRIAVGDVHVNGPWKAAMVIRKTVAGWTALAVVGSATAMDVEVTAVANDTQAQALLKGDTKVTDPATVAAKLGSDCRAMQAGAEAACDSIAKAVASGQDLSLTLPIVDKIVSGDIHVVGPWKAAVVVRRTVAGWTPLAVVGSTTSSTFQVHRVSDDAAAATLMAGQGAALPTAHAGGAPAASTATQTAVTQTRPAPQPAIQAQVAMPATPPAQPAGMVWGKGWVTEVRPIVTADGSKISDDLVSRYIADDVNTQWMGEYVNSLPIHNALLNVGYQRKGVLKAAKAGDYRFALTFAPHTTRGEWTCWARLDFIDTGNRVPVTQMEPIVFQSDTPPARIKSLISSVVTIPEGMHELEVYAQCMIDRYNQNNHDLYNEFLHQASANPRMPNPWPKLVISMQRPGESGYGPLKADEILHDRSRYKDLPLSSAGGRTGVIIGRGNPLKDLGLPDDMRPGWYVDVFPVMPAPGNSRPWALSPVTAAQATFIAPPSGFSLTDHRNAGMKDSDGKIFVANTRFLATKDGRYTFMLNATNPQIREWGHEECVGELTVIDSDNNSVAIIRADGPNLSYSPFSGTSPVSTADIGGIDLTRGAYRLSLRSSCSAHRHENIEKNLWARSQIAVYVRGPSENALRPGSNTDFVFRQAKQ